MKVTVLNGALPGDEFVDKILDTIASQLASMGINVQSWTARDENIAYCLGCFECWTKYPGLCRIADTGRDVTKSIIQSDLVVYLTPVTFGGYSSELKKLIDRNICLVMPYFTLIDGEVHHKPRYRRYPSLLGVGVMPSPDAEQERLFANLLHRNAINMHAPANTTGFVYRNQDKATIKATFLCLLDEVGMIQPEQSLEGTI